MLDGDLEKGTNLYDFLTTLVTLVVVPLITAWITQKRLAPQIEDVKKETTAAKVAASNAVSATVEGNQHLEEVHRAVNGDKEKLTARVQELESLNKWLEAQLAGRRMGENR